MEENNKQQIFIIHGGLTFKNREQLLAYYKNFDIDYPNKGKSWKEWLIWSLEDKYEFIFPKFPTKDNSEYEIWKIIFEKYFVKLNEKELTFVTHSLGTIFLIKYLIENGLHKKIKEIHFVAPIVANEFQPENDPENTATFTFDYSKIADLQKYCEDIHIWHSKDDNMCSFKNAEYLKEKIPNANFHVFENKGHFPQSTFWELFDVLRNS